MGFVLSGFIGNTVPWLWISEKWTVKSEVLLIASIIGTQPKCTLGWKQSLVIKQVSETLFFAIKMCTGCTTDVSWMNTKACSVTSEPYQRSSSYVSFFKDSSVLLNFWEMNFTKVKSFLSLAHCFWWKPKIYMEKNPKCT